MLPVIHRPGKRTRTIAARIACGSSQVVLVALALSACGSPAPTAATATPRPASPTPLPVVTAPPPPSLAVPSQTAPVPTVSAASPITYTVPTGYVITIATDQEIELDSVQGSERLVFVVDPSIESTGAAIGRTTVGGEVGWILERGATSDGLYREIVIVRHAGAQYELACTGFHGYDPSLMTAGCDAFASSIRFHT